MTKWEYRLGSIDRRPGRDEAVIKRLNTLGEEGWEVIMLITDADPENQIGQLLLKRPKTAKASAKGHLVRI